MGEMRVIQEAVKAVANPAEALAAEIKGVGRLVETALEVSTTSPTFDYQPIIRLCRRGVLLMDAMAREFESRRSRGGESRVYGSAKGLPARDIKGRQWRTEPAVSIDESVTADHIYCLEDGRPFRMLKRHLAEEYGLTVAQYRARWGLPDDYPMVAPSYSQEKREHATRCGLGLTPPKPEVVKGRPRGADGRYLPRPKVKARGRAMAHA